MSRTLPWLTGQLSISGDDWQFKQNFLQAIADDLATLHTRHIIIVDDQHRQGIGEIKLLYPGMASVRLIVSTNRIHIDGYSQAHDRIYQEYDLSDPAWPELVAAILNSGGCVDHDPEAGEHVIQGGVE